MQAGARGKWRSPSLCSVQAAGLIQEAQGVGPEAEDIARAILCQPVLEASKWFDLLDSPEGAGVLTLLGGSFKLTPAKSIPNGGSAKKTRRAPIILSPTAMI